MVAAPPGGPVDLLNEVRKGQLHLPQPHRQDLGAGNELNCSTAAARTQLSASNGRPDRTAARGRCHYCTAELHWHNL